MYSGNIFKQYLLHSIYVTEIDVTFLVCKVNNFLQNSTENVNRRYNFAPAQLQGSLEHKNAEQERVLSQPHLIKIPWIKKWNDGIVPFFIDSRTYGMF